MVYFYVISNLILFDIFPYLGFYIYIFIFKYIFMFIYIYIYIYISLADLFRKTMPQKY